MRYKIIKIRKADMTRVLFVRDIGDGNKGGVIAVFIDDSFDNSSDFVGIYEYQGEHSGASWSFIRESTIPAMSSVDCGGSLKSLLEKAVGYTDITPVKWSDVPQLAYPVLESSEGSKCDLCRKTTSDLVDTDSFECKLVVADAGLKGCRLCRECARKFKDIKDEDTCLEAKDVYNGQ